MEKQRKNMNVKGVRTCLSLEKPLWNSLSRIAEREGLSPGDLINMVADVLSKQPGGSLTSAVRVFILAYFKCLAEESLKQADGVPVVNDCLKLAIQEIG